MKPIIDIFTIDMLSGLATEFGITTQELSYWTILPFIIGGMLVIWLVLKLVKGKISHE